jgi:hypothetical protein
MSDFTLKNLEETKQFFKTSEFWIYLAVTAAILIAGNQIERQEGGPDIFSADKVWFYITLLTVGYMISRGIAKSGVHDPSGTATAATATRTRAASRRFIHGRRPGAGTRCSRAGRPAASRHIEGELDARAALLALQAPPARSRKPADAGRLSVLPRPLSTAGAARTARAAAQRDSHRNQPPARRDEPRARPTGEFGETLSNLRRPRTFTGHLVGEHRDHAIAV